MPGRPAGGAGSPTLPCTARRGYEVGSSELSPAVSQPGPAGSERPPLAPGNVLPHQVCKETLGWRQLSAEIAGRLGARTRAVWSWVDLDRAVVFGLVSQAWGLIGGPVTVLLIAHRFSPELQG